MTNKSDNEQEIEREIRRNMESSGPAEPPIGPAVELQSKGRDAYTPIDDQAEKKAIAQPSPRYMLIACILVCLVLIIIMALVRHYRDKRSLWSTTKAGTGGAWVAPDYNLRMSVRSFLRDALTEQAKVDSDIADARSQLDKAVASVVSTRAILNDPNSWKFDRNRLKHEATQAQLLLDGVNARLNRSKALKERLVGEIDVSSRFLFGELDARDYIEQSVTMRVDPQYCSHFDKNMQIACRDAMTLTLKEAVRREIVTREKALTILAGLLNGSETQSEQEYWKAAMTQIRSGRR